MTLQQAHEADLARMASPWASVAAVAQQISKAAMLLAMAVVLPWLAFEGMRNESVRIVLLCLTAVSIGGSLCQGFDHSDDEPAEPQPGKPGISVRPTQTMQG